MSNSQKSRLRKNVSFSNHEKDIYDYLEQCDNASALIKKLVKEHMMMEKFVMQGLISEDLVLNNINYSNLIKNRDVKHETTNSEITDNNDYDNSTMGTSRNNNGKTNNGSDGNNIVTGSSISDSRDANEVIGTEDKEKIRDDSTGYTEKSGEYVNVEEDENQKLMVKLPF